MAAINTALTNARFIVSAPSFSSLGSDEGWEVAFAGRSNAGKSSVLNVLANRKALAKTSSTPGKTRHINLFALDETSSKRLADLPGYGYARVNSSEHARWGEELTYYITRRESLRGVVIVMDIRHPLTENDRKMVVLCRTGGKTVHVLLNKSDKLRKNRKITTCRQFEKDLAFLAPGTSFSAFSALKKDGMPELSAKLGEWFEI